MIACVSSLAGIASNSDALFSEMKSSAASQHNKALAAQIRERATKLADRDLKDKAIHLAQIVEQAQTEAPASVVDLIFRNPTATERDRGLKLEAIARQLLEKHGKALA